MCACACACVRQAMHSAFLEVDSECQRRFKQSGTTATLAVSVGWELLVANVGDSCAFLDTGSEIIQVRYLPSLTASSLPKERT